jgi:hypothetical protein
MPRFVYHLDSYRAGLPTNEEVDKLLHTQTFVCDTCGSRIHFDTNDKDEAGGFIGSVSSEGLPGYFGSDKA